MACLELSLLGTFEVTLNGSVVTGFRTDKMRALLAYLCLEAAHPHRREALMGLLWPDQPEEAASINFRQALFRLRQVLGEQGDTQGFLLITPLTVQFNPASDYRLDASRLCRSGSFLSSPPPPQEGVVYDLPHPVETSRGDVQG